MRGEAAAIASTLLTPCAVSRIAWTRIGRLSPCRASSSARYWSTKWMSQSPSTFGTITTSSLSPISPTSRVMSSRNQGELSALTRAQRPVAAEIGRLRHRDQALARRLLGFDRNGVLEIAEHDVDLARRVRPPWRAASRCAAARSGSCARAGTAVRDRDAARRSRAVRKACGGLSWPTLRHGTSHLHKIISQAPQSAKATQDEAAPLPKARRL